MEIVVGGWIYRVVFLAVFFRHLLALVAEVLLHGRVDDQFLSDGVAGQFPGELVAEALLVVVVVRVVDYFIVVLLEFAVIMSDGLCDAGRALRHDGVCATLESRCGEALFDIRCFGEFEGD